MESCAQFMAAWESDYENCHTCRYWDRDELTCLNKEELARREKAKKLNEMDKLMRRSKAVYIHPD